MQKVGAGSFQWQFTVVGLLIAGELYINFKNKEVEGVKMTELAQAIKNFIPTIEITNVEYPATGDARLSLYDDPNRSVSGIYGISQYIYLCIEESILYVFLVEFVKFILMKI